MTRHLANAFDELEKISLCSVAEPGSTEHVGSEPPETTRQSQSILPPISIANSMVPSSNHPRWRQKKLAPFLHPSQREGSKMLF
jgi:hypothetical protein